MLHFVLHNLVLSLLEPSHWAGSIYILSFRVAFTDNTNTTITNNNNNNKLIQLFFLHYSPTFLLRKVFSWKTTKSQPISPLSGAFLCQTPLRQIKWGWPIAFEAFSPNSSQVNIC